MVVTVENRSSPRELVSGWSAVLFLADGLNHCNARVVDSSVGGFGLTLETACSALEVEAQVVINIKAQHRQFSRKVRIVWMQSESSRLSVGVALIDHVGITPQNHQLDVQSLRIDPATALKLPANIAHRQKVLPFIELDGLAHVVCADIENDAVLTVLQRLLRKPVCLWAADPVGNCQCSCRLDG